jgi:hypothetical protein
MDRSLRQPSISVQNIRFDRIVSTMWIPRDIEPRLLRSARTRRKVQRNEFMVRKEPLEIRCMVDSENGYFLGQEDSACLREASTQGLTLVTYDRRTIPPLLKTWAEEGRTHGGVVFVDERTISPADIVGLVWALTRLAKETGNWGWTNRICFLN